MLRVGLALTALLLAAGCGGTPARVAETPAPVAVATRAGAMSPTPTPAMTHRAFVRALNRSCDASQSGAGALKRRFLAAMGRNALPEAGEIYKAMVPPLAAHVSRVEELKPPAKDQKAFARYMETETRIQGMMVRMVRAMKDDDLDKLSRLSRVFTQQSDRRLTAALDMGADKCGG